MLSPDSPLSLSSSTVPSVARLLALLPRQYEHALYRISYLRDYTHEISVPIAGSRVPLFSCEIFALTSNSADFPAD